MVPTGQDSSAGASDSHIPRRSTVMNRPSGRCVGYQLPWGARMGAGKEGCQVGMMGRRASAGSIMDGNVDGLVQGWRTTNVAV